MESLNILLLELQREITLVILILQSRFSYHICIVRWLRCDVNVNKIGQKLSKLLSKNLKCWQKDEISESWNFGHAENSIS